MNKYLILYQTEEDPFFIQPYITEAKDSNDAKKQWVQDHPEKYKSWQSYIQRTREVDTLTVYLYQDQGDLPELLSK